VKYFILAAFGGRPWVRRSTMRSGFGAAQELSSGFEMYRKKYGRIAPDRIVEFLLLDGEFRRAVALLHRQGRPGAARHHRHAPRRLLLRLGTTHRPAAVGTGLLPAVEAILEGGLHEFFDALANER